jgi:toxin CcdB
LAKFDIWRLKSGTLVVECQADVLATLPTRLVVPLLPEQDVPRGLPRLHPCFTVKGIRRVMATHQAVSIPVQNLTDHLGTLIDHQYEIGNALDMLVTGF